MAEALSFSAQNGKERSYENSNPISVEKGFEIPAELLRLLEREPERAIESLEALIRQDKNPNSLSGKEE